MYEHSEPEQVETGFWRFCITFTAGADENTCTCYVRGTRSAAKQQAAKLVKRLKSEYGPEAVRYNRFLGGKSGGRRRNI